MVEKRTKNSNNVKIFGHVQFCNFGRFFHFFPNEAVIMSMLIAKVRASTKVFNHDLEIIIWAEYH